MDPDQNILGRYKKRTLMPFGEYIPGQQWWPQVREYATLQDVIEAGTDPGPLAMLDGQKLGLVICYEDTQPRGRTPNLSPPKENTSSKRLVVLFHQANRKEWSLRPSRILDLLVVWAVSSRAEMSAARNLLVIPSY